MKVWACLWECIETPRLQDGVQRQAVLGVSYCQTAGLVHCAELCRPSLPSESNRSSNCCLCSAPAEHGTCYMHHLSLVQRLCKALSSSYR